MEGTIQVIVHIAIMGIVAIADLEIVHIRIIMDIIRIMNRCIMTGMLECTGNLELLN